MGFLAFFLGMYSGPSGSSGSVAFLSLVLCGPTCGCFSALELHRRAAEGARRRKHWHTAGVCVRSIQRGTTWFTPVKGDRQINSVTRRRCNDGNSLWVDGQLDSRVTKQEVLCGKHCYTITIRARWLLIRNYRNTVFCWHVAGKIRIKPLLMRFTFERRPGGWHTGRRHLC